MTECIYAVVAPLRQSPPGLRAQPPLPYWRDPGAGADPRPFVHGVDGPRRFDAAGLGAGFEDADNAFVDELALGPARSRGRGR